MVPLTISVIITLVVLVATIGFIFAYHYSKKKHSDNEDKLSISDILFVITFLVLLPLSFILSVNLIILWCKSLGFTFDSVLEYDDTMVVLSTYGATIYVTYFQYKVQKSIDRKNAMESRRAEESQKLENQLVENRRKIENQLAKERRMIENQLAEERKRREREIAEINHKNEMISKQLSSLDNIYSLVAYGINFNLIHSQKFVNEFHEEKYYIKIGGDIKDGACFYQKNFYFDNPEEQISISVKSGDKELPCGEVYYTPNSLSLELKKTVEADRFFMYPAQIRSVKKTLPKLNVIFSVKAADCSYKYVSEGKTENLNISYELRFDLIPDDAYGYTNNASFRIKIDNCRLAVH